MYIIGEIRSWITMIMILGHLAVVDKLVGLLQVVR
jgi:hypothetical protein